MRTRWPSRSAARRPRSSASWSSRARTSTRRDNVPEIPGVHEPSRGRPGAGRTPRVSRSARYALAGFGVFVFLGISLLLARALSATGTERQYVLELARAEARGDVAGVLGHTPACAAQPACAAATRAFATRLKRPGDVEILRYDVSVQLPMTRQIGTGRVAWRAGTGLPVVQCVRVQRDGPLTGAKVELLSVSAPIGNESACP